MTAPLTDLERALIDAATRDDQDEVERITAQLDALEYARRARLAHPDALVQSALWYAHHGQQVFPCHPGGKAPLTRHGLHDASTDPDQIRAWWRAAPRANVGLPTGHLFDVVDLDTHAGLIRFYEKYVDPDEPGLIRAIALTPHGRHLYYDADPNRRNRAGLLPGVDVRATGGYVIAPPSATPDGLYRWIPGKELRL